MKINVLVNPNSKKKSVDKIDNENYIVWVKSASKNNLANQEAISLLVDFFNTSLSKVKIVKGQRGRKKVVVINN